VFAENVTRFSFSHSVSVGHVIAMSRYEMNISLFLFLLSDGKGLKRDLIMDIKFF
jgi:hypothetical protein